MKPVITNCPTFHFYVAFFKMRITFWAYHLLPINIKLFSMSLSKNVVIIYDDKVDTSTVTLLTQENVQNINKLASPLRKEELVSCSDKIKIWF